MNENENMELNKDQESGQITYANEVIATIVSVATTEVQGISGIAGSGPISGILGKGKSPRGVRVELVGGSVRVDISVTVDYGMPIQKVGRNVQENVRKSIESMTGLHVEKVDLHVVGVSFEKENQELQQGQKLAMNLDEQEHEQAPAEESAQEQTLDDVPQYPVEYDTGDEQNEDEDEPSQDEDEEEAEPQDEADGEETEA